MVKCFKYGREKHQSWECPVWKKEEKAAYAAKLQKVQQEKKRQACSTQKKVQEYYKEGSMLLEGLLLLERGWIIEKMVATYMECEGYKSQEIQTHKNYKQRFLLLKQISNIQYGPCQEAWNQREKKVRRREIMRVQCIECRRRDAIEGRIIEQERRKILYSECRTGQKKSQWNWEEVAWPIEAKTQQSGMWTGVPKSAAKEEDSQRNVRRMFKILRKVQQNIKIEKMDTHKGITVKALLDSGTTGILMNKKMVKKHSFKLQKLKKPLIVNRC